MADAQPNAATGEAGDLPTDASRSESDGVASRAAAGDSARYRPLHVHAAGGLGEVLIAEDIELGRQVALKQIKPEFADDLISRRRFLTEAEVTGRLEHPGIVPVYGLGVHADGRPYYAMRFVKGESFEQASVRFHITEWRSSAEKNLALRQLLTRFIDVCDAVSYAHSRGVVHRDLKPANIMLGPYGETLVVDWGLAKSLGQRDPLSAADSNEATLVLRSFSTMGEELARMLANADQEERERCAANVADSARGAGSTRVGEVLGTPPFMSPEQAAGKLDETGPASDVYSLGAILYFLLAGRDPFAGQLADVLQEVQAGDFPPPRAFAPHLSPALEAICLKAMALNPQDRYPTCRDIAADLERWLADEPITAHRETRADAARRWARKHQRFVLRSTAALLVGVVMLAVGLVIACSMNWRLAAEKIRIERAATELREQNAILERSVQRHDRPPTPASESR